jgi:phospholipase C
VLSLLGLLYAVAAAPAAAPSTTTPIKHVVVIYSENVSFDHYFGTYPNANNPIGEPTFTAAAGTPSVDGLTPQLLTANPNLANPYRLDRADIFTCDQLHDYALEQKAFDGGRMDQFVQWTGTPDPSCQKTQVMGYFDGNTVTALWEYAQHYAMSDAFFGSTFGPSTPGALNLIAGQTHGATPSAIPDMVANGTVIGDPDPALDDCSSQPSGTMSGGTIGDALSAKGIAWGWFEGGFRPSSTSSGKAVCGTSHTNLAGSASKDYVPHHEPFQYFPSTANPQHLPPSSVSMIGRSDRANHQYDLGDFWASVDNRTMPAVSFLKAPAYQDGHAGYSSPLDEQRFVVSTINRLQASRDWKDTAVVIAYDDSDGWYDHQMGPIVNQSQDPAHDALNGPSCGSRADKVLAGYQDRCGYGPRLPLLVVSPYAKRGYVDHAVTDQTSILRFVEDNWRLGRLGNGSFDAKAGSLEGLFSFGGSGQGRDGRLILDPATGEPASGASRNGGRR